MLHKSRGQHRHVPRSGQRFFTRITVADAEHRAACISQDVLGDAPEQEVRNSRSSMGSHHNQIALMLLTDPADHRRGIPRLKNSYNLRPQGRCRQNRIELLLNLRVFWMELTFWRPVHRCREGVKQNQVRIQIKRQLLGILNRLFGGDRKIRGTQDPIDRLHVHTSKGGLGRWGVLSDQLRDRVPWTLSATDRDFISVLKFEPQFDGVFHRRCCSNHDEMSTDRAVAAQSLSSFRLQDHSQSIFLRPPSQEAKSAIRNNRRHPGPPLLTHLGSRQSEQNSTGWVLRTRHRIRTEPSPRFLINWQFSSNCLKSASPLREGCVGYFRLTVP